MVHCHKIRRRSLAMPAALLLLTMGALCGFERIPDRFDCIPLPAAFEERPESCVNFAWCACVEVDFPNPEAGKATALHQWHTYAARAPIPGVQTLWVDKGTLNLEHLKPGDVLAHLTIDFIWKFTGQNFLMKFQFVVQTVGGDSADFDFLLVESNDDTREILGYDFQDESHSG